ncbi:hypothetical protein CHS0354_025696 [Potamilus streckersoni]|uniref:Uncharacterized protein n=1 Tax=Potamilus streckersoni TaxID=2493646 RepID=A0AAE0S0K7_9BIVA|nr:hypothetical protein CHS0354_025696 [Potamilus streckersoni]
MRCKLLRLRHQMELFYSSSKELGYTMCMTCHKAVVKKTERIIKEQTAPRAISTSSEHRCNLLT